MKLLHWRRRVEDTHLRTEAALVGLGEQLKELEKTMSELRELLPGQEQDDRA